MGDRTAEAALRLWRRLGFVLAPAARLVLGARLRRGKEDARRGSERLGRSPLARPDEPIAWVHAASVGETMSVITLVERLIARGFVVVMTSGTVASAEIAAARLPNRAIHQYVPVDLAPYVSRFLDHWRPSLAVFVESEIWPVTVLELCERGIPQVLVNARMSERSARRWGHLPSFARSIFGRLALVLAQSEADAERLRGLGARPVFTAGNLKFDGRLLSVDRAELDTLAAQIGDRPRWVAASTHAREEAAAADAHLRLAERFPGLLTIVAPRHPGRRDEILTEFRARGLRVALRSAGERPGPETDVYLCDTIGEMGLVFRLAAVTFLGGSLAPIGGHNPIEPGLVGVAIVHGPNVGNATEIYDGLREADASVMVQDPAELAEAIGRLLADPVEAAAIANRAHAVVERSAGVLDRTLAGLDPLIVRALAADAASGGARPGVLPGARSGARSGAGPGAGP